MDLIEIFKAVILGGSATVIATQIMKWNVIPIPADKYPKVVAAITALIAAGVSVYQYDQTILTVGGFWNWITVAVGTLIVAAITYNNIVKRPTT